MRVPLFSFIFLQKLKNFQDSGFKRHSIKIFTNKKRAHWICVKIKTRGKEKKRIFKIPAYLKNDQSVTNKPNLKMKKIITPPYFPDEFRYMIVNNNQSILIKSIHFRIHYNLFYKKWQKKIMNYELLNEFQFFVALILKVIDF